jgi:hypothetical protein
MLLILASCGTEDCQAMKSVWLRQRVLGDTMVQVMASTQMAVAILVSLKYEAFTGHIRPLRPGTLDLISTFAKFSKKDLPLIICLTKRRCDSRGFISKLDQQPADETDIDAGAYGLVFLSFKSDSWIAAQWQVFFPAWIDMWTRKVGQKKKASKA